MIGAVIFPRVTLCQLCLIMPLGEIEREGVLGACPFEVLSYHQFQLGLLKYILTSLYHYCSVPCHHLEWLDKWSSPDAPSIELLQGGSSDLNHVCRAFNEHTGVYVRFPPQEHMSETYDICVSYMLLYT